ncbi:MAG: NUDIX hydrolase [Planctomycetota bacterium]
MKELWQRLGGELIHDAGIFKVRRDRYEYRGRPVHPFYVLESAPWVNVVPVTDEGEVVLVRQYRHGVQELSLEIPGGVVDAADADPAAAAARELVEETGYLADRWELLGSVTNNPAILDNRTHCYLATGLHRVAEPAPDEHEDLVVERRPAARLPGLIESGEIHHSLSVCALCLYLRRTHT